MPFTPSHAAVALLARRSPLPVAAVAAGAVAPDLPYFAPVPFPRELSHSLLGAVTVDPLFALSALALWWWMLRAPLVALAPSALRRRLPFPFESIGSSARRTRGGVPVFVALTVLAAVLGVLTHLGWDWFTHAEGLAALWPAWGAPVGPLAVDKWAQHASSVLGLAVLAVVALRALRRADIGAAGAPGASAVPGSPAVPRERSTGIRVAALTAPVIAAGVGGLLRWVLGMTAGIAPFSPALVFSVARVTIGSGAAVLVLVVAVWWIAELRRRRSTAAATTSATTPG
ncbi:DUF4184 family protein [Schumannella soli]|uniref:DUF4184 family protein n=1 Tax=Schumannella soli TaxID=2590779 RepID=A0A506Y386_9MICO|nr:DUF4184 family protein [Schumannella soli]TPW76495.1 DUF4184 family protein [Schumannella soli]